MPRWFRSSTSAAAEAPPVPASSPPSEELEKLRKRVEEVAPRAFASLLASQEPGLSAGSKNGFDDDTLTRWLVAEERDVERAAQRLAAHAEWRSALLPAGWTPDKGAIFLVFFSPFRNRREKTSFFRPVRGASSICLHGRSRQNLIK